MLNKHSIIQRLGLEPHIEGGYFRRTFESTHSTQHNQLAMSVIYYLLTNDSPIGAFHQNKSDIIHFYHSGFPIEYTLISPEGQLTRYILGPNLEDGQQFQLLVEGGYWKASRLLEGDYGLISESVCPGFEYSDMQIASQKQMQSLYPALFDEIKHLIKKDSGAR
ncbi:cupin domain-containing protein [Alkalimarinus coralli]|uniref:cupin domain-containing protein n=1 Tax=Alkalimarinus coralli TaxID=2935863 RepID=UPI00202B36F2|nr:cupin domain-containing protein [Alkalimarinus coralli]